IRRLVGEALYADISLDSGEQHRDVAAQPGDAVALALLTGSPTRTAAAAPPLLRRGRAPLRRPSIPACGIRSRTASSGCVPALVAGSPCSPTTAAHCSHGPAQATPRSCRATARPAAHAMPT